jgi:hypothetical protein
MNTLFQRSIVAVFFSLLLSLPQLTMASAVYEEPSAAAMTADLVVARPALVVLTVLGTATFLVALPFSLLGGNTGDAANTLVAGPFKTTFMRCLGCENGRKQDVIENSAAAE